MRADASDAVADGGFESGGFRYWQQCGNVNASITAARAHGGKYTQKSGSAAGEPVGDEGVCQAVIIPPAARLTFWVYQYSTEPDTTFAYQEAQLFDASGTTVKQLYQTASTTNGWEQRSTISRRTPGRRCTCIRRARRRLCGRVHDPVRRRRHAHQRRRAVISGVVVLRFALAIVFDALAFTIWDVGTRPPLRLIRDVVRGVRVPRVLASGLVRFLIGFGLLRARGGRRAARACRRCARSR